MIIRRTLPLIAKTVDEREVYQQCVLALRGSPLRQEGYDAVEIDPKSLGYLSNNGPSNRPKL